MRDGEFGYKALNSFPEGDAVIFRRLLPLCLAVVVGCTEPGVTSKDHGNGLRLTIARLLARQHGGDVRLIAREGGGVVTEFTLPCVPPAGGP